MNVPAKLIEIMMQKCKLIHDLFVVWSHLQKKIQSNRVGVAETKVCLIILIVHY